MRKIKLIFKDSNRKPVIFEGDAIYWDIRQKDLFIANADQIENGEITRGVVNDDCHCTAF